MKERFSVAPLAVLWAGAFLAGFNENLVNMALVSIMAEFSVDSVTAQWLVTGYMIVATVMVMCMAYLYRRFSLRKLFFTASFASFAGSALGLVSPSFPVLMLARLVQAVGTGMFIPLMMNTVLALTPKHKLGAYMSIGSCMITFGPAFAPVVCGALVTAFGWHSVFFVPLIAIAVIAAAGIRVLENLETSTASLDVASVVLASAMLLCLSYGLAEVSGDLIAGAVALGLCAVCAALFAARQFRCEHPLIDLTPVKSGLFWPSLVLTGIAMISTFSCSVLLPLYFEGACGMTALLAGAVILVPVLVNAATTLFAGRLLDAKGPWPLLPLGYAAACAGFVVMVLFAPSLSAIALFAGTLLVFFGVGLVFSPAQTTGLKTLSAEMNPFGVALSTTVVQVAACIGPSLYTGILSSVQDASLSAGAASAFALASGFSAAMVVAAAIALIGVLLSAWYSLRVRRAFGQGANARAKREAADAGERRERAQAPARRDGADRGGRSVIGVCDLMEHDPYVVSCDAPVREVMRMFVAHRLGGVPVVGEDGGVAGFVSDGDIMRYLSEQHPLVTSAYSLMRAESDASFDARLQKLVDEPVRRIATRKALCLPVGASLEEACDLLARHKVKKVPVVEGDRVVGTVNRSDIIRYAMSSALGE